MLKRGGVTGMSKLKCQVAAVPLDLQKNPFDTRLENEKVNTGMHLTIRSI